MASGVKRIIEWYKQSDKNYPLHWLVGGLIIVTTIWYLSSANVARKLNKESKLTVGVVYKVTTSFLYYRFEINHNEFEDSDGYNSGHNYYTGKAFDKPAIGDKVLIRYYPKDPSYNIRISKIGENLDSLYFGQILEPVDLEQLNAWDVD